MSYLLSTDEKLNKTVRKIVIKQINNACENLDKVESLSSEGIHEARKSFKKNRAILRLIRPAISNRYEQENAIWRSFGHDLTQWRDAKVTLATLDQLKDHFGDRMKMQFFISQRKRLESYFNATLNDNKRLHSAVSHLQSRLSDQKRCWQQWSMQISVDDVVSGAQKIYRTGKKAFATAYTSPTHARFHQWRKQVKYHWYHLRLLHELWPSCMEAFMDKAHKLADLLGSEHDLTILHDLLKSIEQTDSNREDMEILFDLIVIQQQSLRKQARPLGIQLFSDSSKGFGKRLKGYIDAAIVEGRLSW